MKSHETSLAFQGIITTKLHPPQVRANIVHRKRLFDKIDTTPTKLVLVAAPAGFGKSTVVLDWLRTNRSTFAWLSLDESDNDPRLFYQYFLSALHTIRPTFGEKLIPVLKGSTVPSAETIMTHLVNELNAYQSAIKLVLDDYYFIEEREIHSALNFFLDHLPPNVQLIISTRVDPMLPLYRMRAKGELIEIRERDLRFTPDEAHDFFGTLHIHLSLEDSGQLTARTEGWIAGLQLAAVSIQDVRNVKNFIDSFTGTNRYILDYLLEEVLNHQSKEVQSFLLQTSILKRFNADICNTITGGMNAQLILDFLERSNLFLIALDENREWFRYHHLFSELLQYRLRQLYPGLIEELHHNASVWFEERGNIHDAINYALHIKNYERVAYLLDIYGTYFLSRSELSTLINYERKLPAGISSQYPRLLIAKAWALMLMHKAGDIDTALETAESLVNDHASRYASEVISFTKLHIATIRAFILRLRGNLRESLDASLNVLEEIPSSDVMIRGLLTFNVGRVYMKQGYAEKAIATLERAFGDNFNAKNYYVSMAILGQTGYLYSVTESLHKARQKLEESIAFADTKGLAGLPAAGYIYYQLGRVLYHINEFDRALEILERAVKLGELGNEPDILCNALIISSRIYAIKGEHGKAMELFSRAEGIEKSTHISLYEIDIINERADLAFLLNDLEWVERWMKEIEALQTPEFTVIDERRYLIMIRYLIQTDEYDKAYTLINELRTRAQERGRHHILLQLDVFEAISLWARGKRKAALPVLAHGLEKASETGYTRVLLNIGQPLQSLVSIVRDEPSLTLVARHYADALLALFTQLSSAEISTIPKFRQNLTEPLTEREQEVLYYISENYSNKELASTLFVSLDTVKTHLRHIYGKLGVNSRKEAVRRARELSLLRE
jgi:LuxR family transcriptional regulator, maltose regulon positive regulatory protein